MNKCRICLSSRTSLCSIFDMSEDKSYAYMISCISKIKIMESEAADKICITCCRKLISAYKFKVLIESSDDIINSTGHAKRIHFDDLQDIKIKIEITDVNENSMQQGIKLDKIFNEEDTTLLYNDTVIKKVEPVEIKLEEKSLSIVDFLNNFQDDCDFQCDDVLANDEEYPALYDDKDDDDEEYTLPLIKRKKKSNTISDTGTKRNKKVKLKKVLIKPVTLKDIEIVHIEKEIKTGVKKKYKFQGKKVICHYCGKFSSNIKHHLLLHTEERSHKCDLCGRGFVTEKDLMVHRKKHTDEKIFKCDHCIAAFRCKSLLKSHISIHSDVKSFVCDICNKVFKRKNGMLRHRLTHSIANKTIKCELCNMSFFYKTGLIHHMRIHTGERPYNCEICAQPYSYKHDFNRHCFKKHGVFLKRRKVYVMNEEVLKRERALMQELMLRVQGFGTQGAVNPFEPEGPQAAQAFEQAIKAIENRKIPLEYHY